MLLEHEPKPCSRVCCAVFVCAADAARSPVLTCCLLLPCLYLQFPEKMIPKFMLLASRGAELPIHGDGLAVRRCVPSVYAVCMKCVNECVSGRRRVGWGRFNEGRGLAGCVFCTIDMTLDMSGGGCSGCIKTRLFAHRLQDKQMAGCRGFTLVFDNIMKHSYDTMLQHRLQLLVR